MQRDIGVSLMPRDAVPVLEPVMLMLAWYIVMGGLRTASLAAFQVVLFRVALFYDTMRSHYRSDNCSLRLEAASCASFTTGAKWIRRNTLEHVFIDERKRAQSSNGSTSTGGALVEWNECDTFTSFPAVGSMAIGSRRDFGRQLLLASHVVHALPSIASIHVAPNFPFTVPWRLL